MMKNDNLKTIFLIISSFIIGGVFTLAILRFTPLVSDIIGSGNSKIITQDKTQIYEKASLAPAVKKIYDAVYVIQVYKNEELISTGTGFIYKADEKYGYLLTNEHVVSKSNDIKVVNTKDEEIKAELLGKDEYLDLAVLRIDKKYVSQISNIGSSEKMELGDTVFTVGSPLGYDYRGSVTSGVLSGKDRMVSIQVSNSSSNDWVMRVLQLDASINPGNSGGPLLNVNGEVIGICSMKLVDDNIEGMGFAIPIEYAMSHVKTLESGKKIKWPLLGISMADVTNTALLAKNNINVNNKVKEGVVIIDIKEGTGAAKSDLKKGDIVIKINDKKTKDIAHLRYELYQYNANDTIEVTYLRNGHEHKTKVTLGSAN